MLLVFCITHLNIPLRFVLKWYSGCSFQIFPHSIPRQMCIFQTSKTLLKCHRGRQFFVQKLTHSFLHPPVRSCSLTNFKSSNALPERSSKCLHFLKYFKPLSRNMIKKTSLNFFEMYPKLKCKKKCCKLSSLKIC